MTIPSLEIFLFCQHNSTDGGNLELRHTIQYIHFRANIFIVHRYFRNGERLENGEWFYSTHRVFEEFPQKFPDFQGTYQQPAQKVYKCVNMFLETGSVLSKKSQWTTDKKNRG
jgi:hypothetical protein